MAARALCDELLAAWRSSGVHPPAHFAARFFGLAALCADAPRDEPDPRAGSLVDRAHRLWSSDPHQVLSPAGLAAALGVHPNTLLAACRRDRGTTTAGLVQRWKLERARALLGTTDHKTQTIARACGFASQSHFIKTFRTAAGRTPAAWRLETRDARPPAVRE